MISSMEQRSARADAAHEATARTAKAGATLHVAGAHPDGRRPHPGEERGTSTDGKPSRHGNCRQRERRPDICELILNSFFVFCELILNSFLVFCGSSAT